ncbi:MAG: MFS transporter [Gammaproteobacteria bacterium]|jgi:MFS family permease|nr:MFS transporter [Gammaproteobacteria bacterium]
MRKHSNMLAGLIVFIASLFYVYEFFLRVMPSVITIELQHDFSTSLGTISLMTACFGYAYALMQIPAGAMIDHFGPRRILIVAVLICSSASFMFMSTTNIITASISRLFIGAASACAFIAPLTLTARWFDSKHFAMVAGIVQMLGCIGAIAGQEPIAMLTEKIGWRDGMFYAASIGMVLAGIFYMSIKDYPPGEKPPEKNNSISEWQRIKTVISNPQTWYIGIAGFACWAPIGALAEFIGPRFLSVKHQISIVDSAGLFIWVWILIGIFSPLIGWWSDHIFQRKKPLLLLGSIALIASLNLIYGSGNLNLDLLWLCLIGVSAGAQPITFALVTENQPKHVIATAIGFNNMAVASGAFITQPIIGSLMDVFWQGEMAGGIPTYSLYEYTMALSLVPACISLGLIFCYFYIHETHCNSIRDNDI